jgi:uncharacterized membrane-anchored protein
MKDFMLVIIGGAMLYGLFVVINQERTKEGRKPLGCIASIVIIIIVLFIWGLLSRI